MNKFELHLNDADDLFDAEEDGKPYVRCVDGSLTLHFDWTSTQSEMRLNAPDELAIGYTRTLMGFLLLCPDPERICMIGLGGGSISKYCRAKLKNTIMTVIEINPDVIELRERFFIPPDDERFQVICADGANFIRTTTNHYDVIIVDGYDATGQPAQLSSQKFYDACHERLTSNGLLIVNLAFCATDFKPAISRIQKRFGSNVHTILAEEGVNKIVFAAKGNTFHVAQQVLNQRLAQLEDHHPVNLRRTLAHLLHAKKSSRISDDCDAKPTHKETPSPSKRRSR